MRWTIRLGALSFSTEQGYQISFALPGVAEPNSVYPQIPGRPYIRLMIIDEHGFSRRQTISIQQILEDLVVWLQHLDLTRNDDASKRRPERVVFMQIAKRFGGHV